MDSDGKMHVDEFRYFKETYGDQIPDWQRHKIEAMVINSGSGLYRDEGVIEIPKFIEQVWKYGQV